MSTRAAVPTDRPAARTGTPDGRRRPRVVDRELVILTPIVIVMLLLVVAFGRYAHGRQLVEQAAAAAARAASLSATAVQADGRARQAASASLSDAGVSCTSMSITVDGSDFRAGGTVGGHPDLHGGPVRPGAGRPPRVGDHDRHRPGTAGDLPAVHRHRHRERPVNRPTVTAGSDWCAVTARRALPARRRHRRRGERPGFGHRVPVDHHGRDLRVGRSGAGRRRRAGRARPGRRRRPAGGAGGRRRPGRDVAAVPDAGRVDREPGGGPDRRRRVLAAAGVTGEVTVNGRSVTVTARVTKPAAILSIVGISEVGGTATATAVPLHGTTTGAP